MGRIYSNAAVTIFAAAGNDPSHGLPGVHHPREPITKVVVGNMQLTMEWDSVRDILHSTWATRGWTLQESYFSRRRLFFTKRQVVFVCNQEELFELSAPRLLDIPKVLFNGTVRPDLSGSHADASAVKALIEMYSRRVLRYHDDALHAVAGVLNALTKLETGLSHFWGVLFRRPIDGETGCWLCLFWTSYKPGDRRRNFPSWSPLGSTGATRYPMDPFWTVIDATIQLWTGNTWKECNTLEHDEIEHARLNPVSESRFLRVTAYIFRLALSWRTVQQSFSHERTRRLYCTGIRDYLIEPIWDTNPHSLDLGDSIVCASLGKTSLLLLQSVKTTTSHDLPVQETDTPMYERIGTIDPLSAELISDPDGIANTQLSNGREVTDQSVSLLSDLIRAAQLKCERGESAELDGRRETFLLG